MKRCSMHLCILIMAIAGEARAAHWTLGASLGRVNGDTGTDDINAQLNDAGLDARSGSSDDNRNAWEIRLGYAFTPQWGLELAYVDLGDVETTFTGTALDIDAFLTASSDIHPNTADGLLFSGVYRYPFGSPAGLIGVARAGAFAWSSEYRLDGVSATRKINENGTDFSFGLGLELDLAGLGKLPNGLAAHLDWQRFKIDSESADLFAIGLSYRFE